MLPRQLYPEAPLHGREEPHAGRALESALHQPYVGEVVLRDEYSVRHFGEVTRNLNLLCLRRSLDSGR